jgi:hypothetical protein
MTTPEIEKQKVPESIQRVQESFSPEQEKRLQEYGVEVRPQNAGNLTDDQGNIIAQSTATDDQAQSNIKVSVPVDDATAQTWSHGSINDSQTWLGVRIIRTIKQALHNGWKLVVGQN